MKVVSSRDVDVSWGRGENRELCKRRGSAREDSQLKGREELFMSACISDLLFSLNKSSVH